ncbi:MAG: hypothetical protein H7Y12_04320 [Sphingobacteriaceae bacterium]|nr:hypothetical protein [Cytophagaceae bacterium]
METAVKTLKEEVIEYLTQSENAQLFEAVKQEIECFEENGRSFKEVLTRLWESETAINRGDVISQQDLENELREWKNLRRK